MKSRRRSQTSNFANAGKRRRTWPKFGQRPFPPHSQPNGVHGDLLMGENLAAMPQAQMQEAEKIEKEELAAKSAEETLQKQEAEDEVMKKEEEEMQTKEVEDEQTQNVQLQAQKNADEESSPDFLR